MSHLLYLTSSLAGGASRSRSLGDEFVAAWQRRLPDTSVVERHLTPDTMPHLGPDTLAALMTAPDARSDAHRDAIALADTLIEELEAANVIVIATPMYNFTVPTVLKAWIDHVARAGRTFRYSAEGPVGLLKNKQVFVVTARGGFYSGESPARGLDFQEPYLRAILAFMGLSDVTFIHAEGLARGPEAATTGLQRARAAIEAVLPTALAA